MGVDLKKNVYAYLVHLFTAIRAGLLYSTFFLLEAVIHYMIIFLCAISTDQIFSSKNMKLVYISASFRFYCGAVFEASSISLCEFQALQHGLFSGELVPPTVRFTFSWRLVESAVVARLVITVTDENIQYLSLGKHTPATGSRHIFCHFIPLMTKYMQVHSENYCSLSVTYLTMFR